MRVSCLPCPESVDELCVQIVGFDLMEADPDTPIVSDLNLDQSFRGVAYLNEWWWCHLILNLRVRFGLVNTGRTPGSYTASCVGACDSSGKVDFASTRC